MDRLKMDFGRLFVFGKASLINALWRDRMNFKRTSKKSFKNISRKRRVSRKTNSQGNELDFWTAKRKDQTVD